MLPEEFQKLFHVSRETWDKLHAYRDLLVKWQKAINLVSPKSIADAWERHFADSAQLSGLIPEDIKTIADLGSGAGFPGLVLAILRPEIEFHLIESDGRKCEFLKNVSRETGASPKIHNKRVEDILDEISPDLITARAFASLSKILDYAEIQSRKNPDLNILLLKGQGADQEILEAQVSYQFEVKKASSKTDKDALILNFFEHKEKESVLTHF